MDRLTVLVVALAAGLTAAPPLAAQPSRVTLGGIAEALQRAGAEAGLASQNAAQARALDDLATLFRTRGVLGLSATDLARTVAGARAPYSVVLRVDPRRVSGAQALAREGELRDAVLRLANIGNGTIVPLLTARGVPPARVDSLLAPLDSLHKHALDVALEVNREKLRRYEVKYGEGSPQLNFAEAVLNVWAQRLPGFGPTRDGTPGPLEIVASYRPTEIALAGSADAERGVVSAGQLGLRRYFFQPGWGNGGRFDKWLRPRHASLTALVVGPEERPLRRAWGRGSDAGVAVGWGSAHVGLLFGSRRRVLLGTDRLVLPHLF